MRKAFFGFAAAVLLVLSGGPESAASEPRTASEFIGGLAERALATMQRSDTTPELRTGTFRTIFQEGFDIPFIGRFVLGRYWRVATEEQRAEYLAAFSEYIVQTYSQRLGVYAGERFEVRGERPVGDGDILVETRIVRPTAQAVPADWRVRRGEDGRFRVIDVLVEGVSMAVTQRSEFASVAQRNGVDGLIEMLQARVGRLAPRRAPS